MHEVAALTERRSAEGKEARKKYRAKYGKDYTHYRDKELVERNDGKANCLVTCQAKESYIKIKPVALRNRGEGRKPEYNKTKKANALTTVQTDSMVEEGVAIRKLTPVECERLQGVPDGYTLAPHPVFKGKPMSNAQRYKTLGNAFNVDVVAHILSFIKDR